MMHEFIPFLVIALITPFSNSLTVTMFRRCMAKKYPLVKVPSREKTRSACCKW